MVIGCVSQHPHLQKGGTCDANAIATIIRATEARIIGRKIEPHDVIVKRLVTKYGEMELIPMLC